MIKDDSGSLTIIKTRLVEAKVPFLIDWNYKTNFWNHEHMTCFYNFTDDLLLIKSKL